MSAIYRQYDKNGRLLYVGFSDHVFARIAGHSRSPWSQKIARIEITRFDDRDEAIKAERIAISEERPIHNLSDNPIAEKKRMKLDGECLSAFLKFREEYSNKSEPEIADLAINSKVSVKTLMVALNVDGSTKRTTVMKIARGMNKVRMASEKAQRGIK